MRTEEDVKKWISELQKGIENGKIAIHNIEISIAKMQDNINVLEWCLKTDPIPCQQLKNDDYKEIIASQKIIKDSVAYRQLKDDYVNVPTNGED
jgi:hypothetical protein